MAARAARSWFTECESVDAQIPSPTATHAATAATADVVRTTHWRRGGSNGTTLTRSAAAASRMRSRSAAGGAGPSTAQASAVADSESAGQLVAAALALREVRLVLPRLVLVERVEGVGGGQVVDVHAVSIPGSPEQLAQARQAGEHPALDRTDGLSEPLGELGLREAAVVRELERLALLVGELLQRRLHALALEAQPRLLVGAACSICGLLRLVERVGAAPLLPPHEVDRAPVHEREDPRARLAALRHEPRRRPPEREEGLLHRVLCERLVAQDAQRQPVRRAGIAVVQLAERRLLRARREQHECLVREMRELAGHASGSPIRHRRFIREMTVLLDSPSWNPSSPRAMRCTSCPKAASSRS